MEKKENKNYLIQSNYFTKSILKDVSEIQKDIIYFLQTQIDFTEPDPTGKVIFNYDKFLKYKKIDIKKNAYSSDEILKFCEGLVDINGMFYNKQTSSTVFFNLFSDVEVNDLNPKEFTISFANFGKIFFYEKFAMEYAKTSKIQYTQIESSIIDLRGDKRKKFFEILSQYKQTGFYKVSLEEFKKLLGFIVYVNHPNDSNSIDNQHIQLRLLFQGDEYSNKYKRQEYLQSWSEFKRVFLDPAIEDFNSKTKLDISNIGYKTIRTGRKITGLHFTFQKRLEKAALSEDMLRAIKYFTEYGLTESQTVFLLQRIGAKEMYHRFNLACTFNRNYDEKNSKYFRQKIWIDNATGETIKKLGGFLYEKVFPELKN
ncbi:replication initiation protein [Chryseobacterium nematophagum]|uniref:Replication initiation protein n=1 Tax=Chryseobacterium nematophagum TaxID=2305228 RepID=A0A3M7TMU7_9FLAO|nr:replication initiation protein [Chryseobacterium nematophagum]RNA63929.1 replication initiation protein [Chryseobacterium nematophagum]